MRLRLLIAYFFFIYSPHFQSQTTLADDYLKVGKTTSAREVLENTVKKNPNDRHALARLGDIAGHENRWDDAAFYYKKLVEMDPLNATYSFKYGGALAMMALSVSRLKAVMYVGDIKKHLEKAARLDKDHVQSRRALVELYMQLPGIMGGSEEKAKQFARELETVAPLEAALAHGYIHKQKNEEAQALAEYKKAMEMFRNQNVRKNRNYLNYEVGKIASEYKVDLHYGLELLNRYTDNYNYLDIHPPGWVNYRRAQIYAHLGNKSEALKLINRAIAQEGSFEEAEKEKIRIQGM